MNKKSVWKPRRIVGGLVGSLVLLAVAPSPASAYPRPGITERVSVASDGAQANVPSVYPAYPDISDDGRYFAFASEAPNLVPGDTNGIRDIFVHDRATGATERVSVTSDGAETGASCQDPRIMASLALASASSAVAAVSVTAPSSPSCHPEP